MASHSYFLSGTAVNCTPTYCTALGSKWRHETAENRLFPIGHDLCFLVLWLFSIVFFDIILHEGLTAQATEPDCPGIGSTLEHCRLQASQYISHFSSWMLEGSLSTGDPQVTTGPLGFNKLSMAWETSNGPAGPWSPCAGSFPPVVWGGALAGPQRSTCAEWLR